MQHIVSMTTVSNKICYNIQRIGLFKAVTMVPIETLCLMSQLNESVNKTSNYLAEASILNNRKYVKSKRGVGNATWN